MGSVPALASRQPLSAWLKLGLCWSSFVSLSPDLFTGSGPHGVDSAPGGGGGLWEALPAPEPAPLSCRAPAWAPSSASTCRACRTSWVSSSSCA